MIYLFLVSAGVIYSICLRVNGQCTALGCKGSSEEIDEILVTTSVMWNICAQRYGQCTMPACTDPSAEQKVCPSGFDFLPEADGCFKVIFQSLNWSQSSEACRGLKPGAHLVAITSAAKQDAIANYLKGEFNKTESSACFKTLWTDGGKSVWIGGQRQNPTSCTDSPFLWKTLDSIEFPFDYNNWLKDEPNCQGGEHCAHVSAGVNYTWNDSNCGLLSCSLCEF